MEVERKHQDKRIRVRSDRRGLPLEEDAQTQSREISRVIWAEGREGYSTERKLHLQKYGEHGTYTETKEFRMGSG